MKSFSSLAQIRKLLFDQQLPLRSVIQYYLENIEKKHELNAIIEVFREEALDRSEQIQKKIDTGKAGKLAGMVIAVKDNICYKDHITSASSLSLENHRAVYHATAIQRLIEEDAIIIGRTNCDEFAMGGTNETSVYGPVLNPVNPSKVAGGSSGGSAAAVAADMCLAALGSDTGGSIRQPASFCGVTGVKPTYGRVSRYGLIAYGSSFDQIGPITKNLPDAAAILEVIAGSDEFDTTASVRIVPAYTRELDQPCTGMKIACLEETITHKGLDPEIWDYMKKLIESLRNNGHQVNILSFPYFDYLVPAYYVMAMAEASSNLARYDGIHYGYRNSEPGDMKSTYTLSRSESFGLEVKRRIMTGTFVLSAGYYDAYYAKAQKVRRLISEKTQEIFDRHEMILLPTTPRTAFDLGSMGDDPVALYLEDIFTTHANLAGIPAVSLPLGRHSNGLPFGVQLMADRFEEGKLMAFGHYLENVTGDK
jgi:aspartyl-tRNA(Asn)/glutamyl-tRNA(Gln) amidotransferase subunit A